MCMQWSFKLKRAINTVLKVILIYILDISAVKPLVVSLSLFHFGSQFSKIPKVSESNQYISNLL